jgi:hypothetical protein
VPRLPRYLRGEDLDAGRLDGGREIRIAGLVVVAGFVVAVAFHVAYGLLTHWRYPYSTFLYSSNGTFGDFLSVYESAKYYGTSSDETNVVYSPLAHAVLTALTRLPEALVFVGMYVLFAVTFVAVCFGGVTRRMGSRRLRWVHVAIFGCLSYPVLFAIQLANVELVMFVLLALFVYLYYEKHSTWAWLPLALAVGSKYWYAVFIVAFLWDRQWRQAVWCVLLALLANVGAALALARSSGASVAQVLAHTRGTLGDFGELGGTLVAVQHGHTVWGVVQIVDSLLYRPLWRANLAEFYPALAVAVFLLVVVRMWDRPKPPWLGLTVLLACGFLLPYQSHDYTLIHLYLPLALIGLHGLQTRGGAAIAVVFGLLLVPMSYGVLRDDVTVSMIIYPVLLAVLALMAMRLSRTQQRHELEAPPGREPPVLTSEAGGTSAAGSPGAG